MQQQFLQNTTSSPEAWGSVLLMEPLQLSGMRRLLLSNGSSQEDEFFDLGNYERYASYRLQQRDAAATSHGQDQRMEQQPSYAIEANELLYNCCADHCGASFASMMQVLLLY
jgi:hypothetical protein